MLNRRQKKMKKRKKKERNYGERKCKITKENNSSRKESSSDKEEEKKFLRFYNRSLIRGPILIRSLHTWRKKTDDDEVNIERRTICKADQKQKK